jgi:hypothetical protein
MLTVGLRQKRIGPLTRTYWIRACSSGIVTLPAVADIVKSNGTDRVVANTYHRRFVHKVKVGKRYFVITCGEEPPDT